MSRVHDRVAVIGALSAALLVGVECHAGAWHFLDTQFNSAADYDYKLEIMRVETGVAVQKKSKDYTFVGYNPEFHIYSWSVSESWGTDDDPTASGSDFVYGRVMRRYLGGAWTYHTQISGTWIP